MSFVKLFCWRGDVSFNFLHWKFNYNLLILFCNELLENIKLLLYARQMRKITKKKSVRLSTHIVPERYNIKLKPDLEKFTFEGEETITLQILKPTKTITLHSKELDIEVVEIMEADPDAEAVRGEQQKLSKKVFAVQISYDEKAETATFHFAPMLYRGEVKIHLIFRGILN